ncbi:hypothetical protein POV27_04205 [Aureisphaera galaxeae]|uniref:hypothetical protein n=1 Tax=Aureisphaera galaxeae TaxID=1538023 RepID=UPI002350CBE4|nr:hypothetical protein [Aureisphaera galaxeae]MDC8003238.1 hypothetical protein [Aureisphaera galaxeae]
MKKLALTILSLLCLALTSCENEPAGEDRVNYETFEVASDLYALLERTPGEAAENPLECIDFNYPFVIFIFDENMEYVQPSAIHENEQFIGLLNAMPDNYSISISYPIKGTQTNGELLEINNNEELKEALEACEKDEEIRNCNGSFRTCYWEIDEWEGYPNDYEGEYIAVNDHDILQLHSGQGIYFGSWVTFHIGDELHMNISFIKEEETPRGEFWNNDWKVITLTSTLIELEYNNQRLRIIQNCEWQCQTQVYQVCELEDNPGVAQLNLQDYSLCTEIPEAHDRSDSLKLTYFETEQDAIDETNEIDPTEYTTLSSPQTIYFRIETVEDIELLGIGSYDIEVIPCDPLSAGSTQ